MPKAAELREFPDEALIIQLEEAKEELFNLRFQLATGELDNPARMKSLRHDVARILTVLRERESEDEIEQEVSVADAEAVEEAGKRRLLRRRQKAESSSAPSDATAEETPEARSDEGETAAGTDEEEQQ